MSGDEQRDEMRQAEAMAVPQAGPPQEAPRDLTDIEVAENLLRDASRELKMMREQLAFCQARLGVLDLVDRLMGNRGGVMGMVGSYGPEHTIERWLEQRKAQAEKAERFEKFKQQTAQPSRFDQVGDELGRGTVGREGW